MTRAWSIVMTTGIENFDEKFVKHCDDKGMELAMTGVMGHCDDKCMENCDDNSMYHCDENCHGAL